MRRPVEWSPDAAYRRACAALTNTMASSVCAANAAMTDSTHDLVLVRPNVGIERLPKAVRSNDGLDAQCGRGEPVLTRRERDWWN